MAHLLKQLTLLIARIHDHISALMYSLIPGIDDKFLHFMIIGLMGLLAVLVTYPIFKALANRKLYFAITFIYVFSLLTGLTLAIEIGQKITGTGNMEFADIAAGLLGFLLMFAVLVIVIYLVRYIRVRISSKEEDEKSPE